MQTIAQTSGPGAGRASPVHVENVIDLLDQGNTIPFIARYRKELHGAMDDTALRKLEDRLTLSAESGAAAAGGEVRHRGTGAS